MSAMTAFNSRVRDAGDLERDSKLYGSFRSISRFDLDDARKVSGERKKSRHEDILIQNVSLMQPAVEGSLTREIAQLPPTSSKSSKDGKKRSKKSESKKPPRPKETETETTSNLDVTKSRRISKENEDETMNKPGNDEDDIMGSLRRRNSRNRRRRQEKENHEPSSTNNTVELNASLNEPSLLSKERIPENKSKNISHNSKFVIRLLLLFEYIIIKCY